MCTGCGAVQPATRTDNTLVGARGWRVLRRANAQSVISLEWRCPTCWSALKRSMGAMLTPGHEQQPVAAKK